MSKDTGKGAAAVTAAVAVKARKSTKGVPRVTDKVVAMDEAGRKAWLSEKCANCTDAQRKEVEARLTAALTGERKVKAVNFATIFKGRTVEELTAAQTALTTALAEAAVDEENRLNAIVAKANAQIEALKAAKADKAKATAVKS